MMPQFSRSAAMAAVLLVSMSCTGTVPVTVEPPGSPPPAPPPPPPAPPPPVPLTLTVTPLSRRATAQPGAIAPSDNAAIAFTGDNAASAAWTVTHSSSWSTLMQASGNGNGSLAWTRNTSGLAVGTYVDTITIGATGAAGSPAYVIDTLEITAAPVPLALVVTPRSASLALVQGIAGPDGDIAVTLSGDGAAQAPWTISGGGSWTSLSRGSGAGSGTLAWHRSAAGLSVGIHVDTFTVSAAGALGSPARMIDTLVVTAPPVPLALAVSPASRYASIVAVSAAPGASATITLSGDGAANAAWSATKRKPWTGLVTPTGTGSATLDWNRSAVGLGAGTYVDTITVVAAGANGSPATVIDTLVVTPAPVPLVLTVSPPSRFITIVAGNAAAAGGAAVTLTGDNASAANWTATKHKAWTSLVISAGAGSAIISWNRLTGALGAGTYVDTITITAAGALNSPTSVIDTIVVTAPSGGGSVADLGLNANLHGRTFFSANDLWNRPVDTAQVDPSSGAILSLIGLGKSLHPDFGANYNGGPFGIPYIVVPDNQARISLPFDYSDESDPGPYPIPVNPPIEPGGGDQHLLVITQTEWKLYELFDLTALGAGWRAGSGAIFDLTNGTTRPAGWTSADAAGLPILPGLVRYDEVYLRGLIDHALRFTVVHTRDAYVAPASHVASSSSNPLYAPMGMRVRLKASFDISGYPAPMQVILRALKKYGMMVADNGSDFFLSGTADARWNDAVNDYLKQLKVSDFEVVKMGTVVTP